jgi:putative spermidine/putrescine transport system permease protein
VVRSREWQLALPLALAFRGAVRGAAAAAGRTSASTTTTRSPSRASRAGLKFFGDPFNYKVIGDTLLLGAKTVCTTVLIGYPLALVYLDLSPRLQKVLLFIIVHAAAALGRGPHLRLDRGAGPRGRGQLRC